MAKNIQSIRGMNDYLPTEVLLWQHIELVLKGVLTNYGYSEIRFPLIEQTTLFQRAIGEITDVVEKEMYTFINRNGKNFTLRPEGTAGCVRAVIEHGLLYNQEQRLWYIGPMFRYERPQMGRYRQFHQIGVETFGQKGPDVDAELILLTVRWWHMLGISRYVSLELNSIGTLAVRIRYRRALITFLDQHKSGLNNDYYRHIYTNPMRVLDSKDPDIQTLLNDAPMITDYLDDNSRDHFNGLCKLLDLAHVPYIINPRLVRGLDYYNNTVFEWVTNSLGSQGTICGGGRYDRLIEQLGGSFTYAVGLATGLERLVLLVKTVNPSFGEQVCVDVYLVAGNDNVKSEVLLLAERLRDALPTLRLMTNYKDGSLKKKFKRADKCGARIVLVLGENEVLTQQVILKDLVTGHLETLTQIDIIARLALIFKLREKHRERI